MTDRELLENAAKAAGMTVLTVPWPENPDGWFWCEHSNKGAGLFLHHDVSRGWNPLTDYGDAIGLAVKLSIDVTFRFVGGQRCEVLAPGGQLTVEPFDAPGCNGEATRRAIVRAAAEIGKGMK